MNPFWLVLFAVANTLSTPQPFQVQFMRSQVGREVVVCIDGQKVERTFAGKMSFRDESHSWQSVCADVRSPVSEGQVYAVRAVGTQKYGGNVAKAGNIVARFFAGAQTPDQCAGLQLAVWKALEDGTPQADFTSGRLRAQAGSAVIAYAQQYYQAIDTPGNATFLQAQQEPPSTNVPNLPQSQMSTT